MKHGKTQNKSLQFFLRDYLNMTNIHIERAHCVSRRQCGSGNL